MKEPKKKTTTPKFITSENIGKLSCWNFHWLFAAHSQTTLVFLIRNGGDTCIFTLLLEGRPREHFDMLCAAGWIWRQEEDNFLGGRSDWEGERYLFMRPRIVCTLSPHSFRTLTSTRLLCAVCAGLLTFFSVFCLSVSPLYSIWKCLSFCSMDMVSDEHVNRHINLFAHFLDASDFFPTRPVVQRETDECTVCDMWFLF